MIPIDIVKRMNNRINLKITLTDGNSWVTGFNGTLDEAHAYFMGRRFEAMNPYTGEEYMQEPVSKVELI